jgi:heat shock protein HslJ
MPHPRPHIAALGLLSTLLLATLVLGACGSSPGAAGGSGGSSASSRTPELSELAGGTWVADSVSSPDHHLVQGSTIVLTFTSDSIAVNAGCNNMHGGASISNGLLVVTALASTMMACEDALAQQDHWVQAFLTSRPAITETGDVLRLSQGSTTIDFAHHA